MDTFPMTRFITFFALLVVLDGTIQVKASVVTANSGSFIDVSNACLSAGFGGTVWIPPGTNNWASSFNDIGVNLYGSNSCSITFTNNSGTFGLYLQSCGRVTTISNIVFDITGTGPTGEVLGLDGSNVCFRVTACTFLDVAQPTLEGIKVDAGAFDSQEVNGPWGIIDHCNFYMPDNDQPYNIINVHANGYFSLVGGFGWSYPMTWGTTNTVDIESCNFALTATSPNSTQAACEGFGGGRACIRYCNFTNIVESTHGPESGTPGQNSGFLQMEMYMNNWFYNNSQVQWNYLYNQRGGSAMIWSNTWVNVQPSGNVTEILQFRAECAETGNPESCNPTFTYPSGYPMAQQVGQGLTSLNTEGLTPVYIWNNNYPASGFSSQFRFQLGIDSSSGPFIQQGLDVYTNTAAPVYTPLAYPSPLITFSQQPVVPIALPPALLTH